MVTFLRFWCGLLSFLSLSYLVVQALKIEEVPEDLPATTTDKRAASIAENGSWKVETDASESLSCVASTASRVLTRLHIVNLQSAKCLAFYVDSTVQEVGIQISGGTLNFLDSMSVEELALGMDFVPNGNDKHVFRLEPGLQVIKILPNSAESTDLSEPNKLHGNTNFSDDISCYINDITEPIAKTLTFGLTRPEEKSSTKTPLASEVVISDENAVEIQVSGNSSLNFLVTFVDPVTMETLQSPPVSGDYTIVKVAIMCTNEITNMTHLLVYDSAGEITNHTTAEEDAKTVKLGFTSFLIETPRESFYLGLEGYDNKDNKFRRVSTDLVQPKTIGLSFVTPAFTGDLTPKQTLDFQIQLRNKGPKDVFEVTATFDFYMDYFMATILHETITLKAEAIRTIDISISVHDSITQKIGSNLSVEVKRMSDKATTILHRWVVAQPTSFSKDTEPPVCEVVYENNHCQPEAKPDGQFWNIMVSVTDQSGVLRVSFVDTNTTPQSFIRLRTVLGRMVADVFYLDKCESQRLSLYVEDVIGNHQTCTIQRTSSKITTTVAPSSSSSKSPIQDSAPGEKPGDFVEDVNQQTTPVRKRPPRKGSGSRFFSPFDRNGDGSGGQFRSIGTDSRIDASPCPDEDTSQGISKLSDSIVVFEDSNSEPLDLSNFNDLKQDKLSESTGVYQETDPSPVSEGYTVGGLDESPGTTSSGPDSDVMFVTQDETTISLYSQDDNTLGDTSDKSNVEYDMIGFLEFANSQDDLSLDSIDYSLGRLDEASETTSSGQDSDETFVTQDETTMIMYSQDDSTKGDLSDKPYKESSISASVQPNISQDNLSPASTAYSLGGLDEASETTGSVEGSYATFVTQDETTIRSSDTTQSSLQTEERSGLTWREDESHYSTMPTPTHYDDESETLISDILDGSMKVMLVLVFSFATAVTCGLTIRSCTRSKNTRGSYKPAYNFNRSKRMRMRGPTSCEDGVSKPGEFYKMTVYKSNENCGEVVGGEDKERKEETQDFNNAKVRADSGRGESFASMVADADEINSPPLTSSGNETCDSGLRKRYNTVQEQANNKSSRNHTTAPSGSPNEHNMVRWLADVNPSVFEPQNKAEIYQSIEQFRETLTQLEQRRNKLVGAAHESVNQGGRARGDDSKTENRCFGKTTKIPRNVEKDGELANITNDVAVSHYRPRESPFQTSDGSTLKMTGDQKSSPGANLKKTCTIPKTIENSQSNSSGDQIESVVTTENLSSSRPRARLQQGHVGMLIEGATQISLRHQIEKLKERLLQCSRDVEDALKRERSMYDNLSDHGIDEDIDTDTDSDVNEA